MEDCTASDASESASGVDSDDELGQGGGGAAVSAQEELQPAGGGGASVPSPPCSTGTSYFFTNTSLAFMIRCLGEAMLPTLEEILQADSAFTPLPSHGGKNYDFEQGVVSRWKNIMGRVRVGVARDNGLPGLFTAGNASRQVLPKGRWYEIVMGIHTSQSRHMKKCPLIRCLAKNYAVGPRSFGITANFVEACIASCSCCKVQRRKRSHGGIPRQRWWTEEHKVDAEVVPEFLVDISSKHMVVLIKTRFRVNRSNNSLTEVYICRRGKLTRKSKHRPSVDHSCECGFKLKVKTRFYWYDRDTRTFGLRDPVLRPSTADILMRPMHTGHVPSLIEDKALLPVHSSVRELCHEELELQGGVSRVSYNLWCMRHVMQQRAPQHEQATHRFYMVDREVAAMQLKLKRETQTPVLIAQVISTRRGS